MHTKPQKPCVSGVFLYPSEALSWCEMWSSVGSQLFRKWMPVTVIVVSIFEVFSVFYMENEKHKLLRKNQRDVR